MRAGYTKAGYGYKKRRGLGRGAEGTRRGEGLGYWEAKEGIRDAEGSGYRGANEDTRSGDGDREGRATD